MSLPPVADPSDWPLERLVSLEGRSAVVTGGGAGIGRAVVRRLAEAGASVVIGDIDEPAAALAAQQITERFAVAAISTTLDVTDSTSVAATADAALDAFGGIDIWVNNAGVYPSTPLLELGDEEWDQVLDLNLRGAFIGCREAARRRGAGTEGGVIVNLSSIAGIRGRGPGVAHYVASKHGIIGITRQLALELAEARIRVLAVAPTTIATPGVQAALTRLNSGHPPDLQAVLAGPLGRAGTADDVARVVLFCASDLAMFMTGSTLLVDAGEMAR